MEHSARASHLAGAVTAVLLLAAASVSAIGGENGKAGSLPVNKWTVLNEGGPRSAHGRMTWLPDAKCALVWPNWHPRAGKGNQQKTAKLHFFDPEKSAWSTKPSDLPKDAQPAPQSVASPYVYLPGLKKVLFLAPPWYSRTKAATWLLDPSAGKWEGIAADLQMSTAPKECGVPISLGCYPVPAWGALCYDAHNGEAVSLGGGGVWGRIDVAKERVDVGDWIFDEKTTRVRRLVPAEEGKVTEARRFHPGNAGTWIFSEKTRKWTAASQNISAQPSGRVLPGMAYDAEAKKIVAFGGDDLTRCLGDTWIYDCKTKKWSEAKPKTSPPARAGHAMVYVPDQKTVLMAGGYATAWRPQSDTWVYDIKKNEWTQLNIALPSAAFYCSAVYAPELKSVLLRLSSDRKGRSGQKTCGLRLNLGSAGRAVAAKASGFRYHCMDKEERQPTPEEYDSAANKGTDPAAGRAELAALPVNTWVERKTPLGSAERRWGFYGAYDTRTHKAYAWGGGHGGYQGADVTEYDVLRNRWVGMIDPPAFKHPWRHKNSGDSPPGLTYQGCILIQSHGRKSHGVDPLSDNVITSHGDVYSIAERRFVGFIGRCPGRWHLGDQVGYVTAPHGLYAFTGRGGKGNSVPALYRANVSGGRWDLVAADPGGPKNHSEANPMAYDSKRDAVLYFRARKGLEVWLFSFKEKKWAKQEPAGKLPPNIAGDPAYVPDLDAAVFLCAQGKDRGAPPVLYFYKVGERKWYSLPFKGERPASAYWLNNSAAWDPQLKLLVHLSSNGHSNHWIKVLVMRPDFKTLELRPIGG
ncbi:MAG: Kelch repeat-containing protein [Planctomycetota bacterium]|jgi:hypothetical protein